MKILRLLRHPRVLISLCIATIYLIFVFILTFFPHLFPNLTDTPRWLLIGGIISYLIFRLYRSIKEATQQD